MSILGSNATISTPAELVAVTAAKDLAEAGPWPDYIDMSFEDDAGNRYRLEVETYHGTGGSWKRL